VKTAIFRLLQNYARVNLVRPVDAPHMWHAAMENKSCELTVLGEHYRGLGRIDNHCIQIIAAARCMKPVKWMVRLFEAAEAALDPIALLVGGGVMRDDDLASSI
jgi:hypothetical protein